jgi:transposase
VERDWLAGRFRAGRSVESIARERGVHPSTVYYWTKKHGLRSPYATRHAPRGPIDEQRLRSLVARGLTVREIAAAVDRGTSSVRHWLGVYGLKTERQLTYRADRELPPELSRHCKWHGRTRFIRMGRRGYYRCAACNIERVSERRRQVKRLLVLEAGGRCALCGYNRYLGALQFHHLDPKEKEFVVSLRGATRSIDLLRAEARKCALLCANCHAEVEAGVATLPVSGS